MSKLSNHIEKQLLFSKSIIFDDKNAISYNECKRIIDSGGSGKKSFNALLLKNRLTSILQVIDCLVYEKDFFVLNGSSKMVAAEGNLTTFCENIICEKGFNNESRSLRSISTSSINPFFRSRTTLFDNQKSYLVLKTSGTTSSPKFVLHDQSLVLKNSKRSAEKLGLEKEDKVLIPVPIHHSYGLVTALFPSLISGCSIRLVKDTNVIKLIEAIRLFKPTVLFATPGLIEMLLSLKTSIRIPKVTITAGDKIRDDLFLKYENRIGTLLNLYGSTEMGAMAISKIEYTVNQRANGCLSALPGLEFKLKDCGSGLGTIQCKSDSGFIRYLNFHGEPESRDGVWFSTKDLGRLVGEQIQILGRSDQRINRNGVLLSYYEIESAIELACNELKKAIVVQLADRGMMGVQFVTVCELKQDNSINANQIRQKCLKKLSRGMVPDAVEIMEEMPLLPNGKVDRSYLQRKFM